MAFDVEGARRAGYSETEIADHLARTQRFDAAAARKAGYSDADLINHLNTQITGKKQAPTPKPAAKSQTMLDKATGFMANVNRGLGIGDEIAGGVTGLFRAGEALGRGRPDQVVNAFQSGMRDQRAREDAFQASNPTMAALGRGIGNAGTLAVPSGATANALIAGSRAGNMVRGAVTAGATGAAYAAADRGTVGERLTAASQTARNPVVLGLGAAGGAIAPAVSRAPKAPKAQTKAPTSGQILADVGVSTSIPQRMGRAAKGVEDILKRFPITGQAMAGYQDRQIGQLNRAIGLKALQPLGKGIPKEVKPGFEMVQYVDDQIGQVYDDAAKLVPRYTLDRELQEEFAQIAKRAVDLPESEAQQFARIINDRTSRLQTGASGEMAKQIHSELGRLQAEAAKKGQDTLAAMIGDTRRAIMGPIARANPEAGRMINRADQAWGVYSIMNDAAAAASARGGMFLPGQLNTQVRSAARRMGSNMAGKGRGPLQDIATAASETIPDSFGNPGTANATLFAGGGVGAITEPTTAIAAGAGLGAVAAPYVVMGRRVIESLPENAGARELAIAERQLRTLVARDPNVAPLLREVSARLSRAAGVAGSQRQPSVEVYVEGRPDLGYGASYGPAGR